MAEYNDAKPAIIGVEIILTLTVNSLVIAVLMRYPQLREDRTTLFVLSQSLADLANGCIAMPLGAAVCSRATPFILNETKYLPKINVLALWWFRVVSLYSLCWMTMAKVVAIIMPFRSEQIVSRRRCHIIIVMTWIVCFLLATATLKVESAWHTSACTYRYPKDWYNYKTNIHVTICTMNCTYKSKLPPRSDITYTRSSDRTLSQ